MQLRPVQEVSWPEAPRPRKRRLGRVLLLLVPIALLFGGYVVWWLNAAEAFRTAAVAWIEQRHSEGWHLSYTGTSRIGFPFRLGVRFEHPTFGDPGTPNWSLTAARAKLTTPLGGEPALRLALGGDLAVTVSGATGRQRWSGRAGQFSFDVVPAEGWMPNGRLALREMLLHPDGGEDEFAIGRADLISTGDPAAADSSDISTWSVDFGAQDLRLPRDLTQACGREMDRVAVTAKLMGGLRASPWPAALRRWRDAGGVVEIQRVGLACGPVLVESEGTLALDDRGQPMGAMSMRIQGYEPALDRLAAAHTVDPHTAAAAKILLRALARSNADGASTLTAPLTLQDRTLSIGPVSLLRVPQVDWLGGPAAR